MTANDSNQEGAPSDEYGNCIFFEGVTVTFYIAETGEVANFLGSKEIPKKTEKGLKAVCQMVDSWKGQFIDQRKWKPMGTVTHNGANVTLTALKKDQVRIGCVAQPGFQFYMVYGTTKNRNEWAAGEILQFENAAKTFLDDLDLKKGERKNEKE